MGDAVVEHHLHCGRWEQLEYARGVTDHELIRGFERAQSDRTGEHHRPSAQNYPSKSRSEFQFASFDEPQFVRLPHRYLLSTRYTYQY